MKLRLKAAMFALIPMLLFSTLAIPIAVTVTGCSAIQEGHDPVVVRSEQASRYAFEIFDTFVTEEERNRVGWRAISPDIEKTANRIRRQGRQAVEELVRVTRVYKYNRTPENKANVETWLLTVQELVRLAENNLAIGRAANQ